MLQAGFSLLNLVSKPLHAVLGDLAAFVVVILRVSMLVGLVPIVLVHLILPSVTRYLVLLLFRFL